MSNSSIIFLLIVLSICYTYNLIFGFLTKVSNAYLKIFNTIIKCDDGDTGGDDDLDNENDEDNGNGEPSLVIIHVY